MAKEIIEWIGRHLWTIVLIVSLFIQFTPIKINPWTSLFKWIGKLTLGDTTKKLDEVINKVDSLERDVKTNEKDRIRWEILDFANSCRHGRLHTKDEFEHIITLNKKYKKLLKETLDSNGVFELEYEYIKKLYAERQEKNDFL